MSGDSSIFGRLLADWDHVEHAAGAAAEDVSDWFRRDHPYPDASQAPAVMPVNVEAAPAAQPEENDMSELVKLEADVKNDLTEGMTYLEGLVGRVKAAAPGIIGTIDQVSGSTVGKLIETAAGRILPSNIEDMVVTFLAPLFDKYGQPAAPAAPADPAVPVAAAPAAQ